MKKISFDINEIQYKGLKDIAQYLQVSVSELIRGSIIAGIIPYGEKHKRIEKEINDTSEQLMELILSKLKE